MKNLYKSNRYARFNASYNVRVQLYVKAVASKKEGKAPCKSKSTQRQKEREIEKVYLLSPDYILGCKERERENQTRQL